MFYYAPKMLYYAGICYYHNLCYYAFNVYYSQNYASRIRQCLIISKHKIVRRIKLDWPNLDSNRVIPCQINKQNAFASQISTKLGGLVPSMKLFSHAYFGCVKLYGFGNIGPTIFQLFWYPAPQC